MSSFMLERKASMENSMDRMVIMKRTESVEKKITIMGESKSRRGDNNSSCRDHSNNSGRSLIEVKNYISSDAGSNKNQLGIKINKIFHPSSTTKKKKSQEEKLNMSQNLPHTRVSQNYSAKNHESQKFPNSQLKKVEISSIDVSKNNFSNLFEEEKKNIQQELLTSSILKQTRAPKISIKGNRKSERARPVSPGTEVLTAQNILQKIKEIYNIQNDKDSLKKNKEAISYLSGIVKKFGDTEDESDDLRSKMKIYEQRVGELAQMNEVMSSEVRKVEAYKEKIRQLEVENLKFRHELGGLKAQ